MTMPRPNRTPSPVPVGGDYEMYYSNPSPIRTPPRPAPPPPVVRTPAPSRPAPRLPESVSEPATPPPVDYGGGGGGDQGVMSGAAYRAPVAVAPRAAQSGPGSQPISRAMAQYAAGGVGVVPNDFQRPSIVQPDPVRLRTAYDQLEVYRQRDEAARQPDMLDQYYQMTYGGESLPRRATYAETGSLWQQANDRMGFDTASARALRDEYTYLGGYPYLYQLYALADRDVYLPSPEYLAAQANPTPTPMGTPMPGVTQAATQMLTQAPTLTPTQLATLQGTPTVAPTVAAMGTPMPGVTQPAPATQMLTQAPTLTPTQLATLQGTPTVAPTVAAMGTPMPGVTQPAPATQMLTQAPTLTPTELAMLQGTPTVAPTVAAMGTPMPGVTQTPTLTEAQLASLQGTSMIRPLQPQAPSQTFVPPYLEMYDQTFSRPIPAPAPTATTGGRGRAAGEDGGGDGGGGGGDGGGGGGGGAAGMAPVMPVLPTPADPTQPDVMGLIADLDSLPTGKIWEMQPRLQRMLALMGEGFRNTFLEILRRMGFRGMGDTGLYGFEADWMTPDAFVLTPEIEALIRSLDSGQVVMMRLVLNDLMDLPATSPTAPTTPTDTNGTTGMTTKPDPIATIQPIAEPTPVA